jgi:hypothetical protein
MTPIALEADLDRAATDVYALVADADNKLLGHATNPPRPGMPLSLPLRSGTQTVQLKGKVVAAEPGRRLAAHYSGPGLEGDLTYTFEPLPFATRLRLVADWQLAKPGGLTGWLASRAVRAHARATLDRIRRLARAKD